MRKISTASAPANGNTIQAPAPKNPSPITAINPRYARNNQIMPRKDNDRLGRITMYVGDAVGVCAIALSIVFDRRTNSCPAISARKVPTLLIGNTPPLAQVVQDHGYPSSVTHGS